MKENEFDDLIQSKLSDYSSKTNVSEENIWENISKSITYNSSIIGFIVKPWFYIPILSIIGLTVFLISNTSNSNQSKIEIQKICNDSLHKEKIDIQKDSIITPKINSAIEVKVEEKKDKEPKVKDIQITEEKNVKETIEVIENQKKATILEQEPPVQPIEQKVEPRIIKKEVQITDTVIKTKRMRKR